MNAWKQKIWAYRQGHTKAASTFHTHEYRKVKLHYYYCKRDKLEILQLLIFVHKFYYIDSSIKIIFNFVIFNPLMSVCYFALWYS